MGLILLTLVLALILLSTLATIVGQNSNLAAKIAFGINISRDGSFSELVNYGICFFAAMMFFLAFLDHGCRSFIFLSVLSLFIWYDDAMSYHERVGKVIVEKFELSAFLGLRSQDTGEFIAWAFAGMVLSGIFLWSLRRRCPGDFGILATVFAPFLMLVFFGVVVDFLHVLVPARLQWLAGAVGTIEDGGEMLSVALIATLAVGIQRNTVAYHRVCGRRQPNLG